MRDTSQPNLKCQDFSPQKAKIIAKATVYMLDIFILHLKISHLKEGVLSSRLLLPRFLFKEYPIFTRSREAED